VTAVSVPLYYVVSLDNEDFSAKNYIYLEFRVDIITIATFTIFHQFLYSHFISG